MTPLTLISLALTLLPHPTSAQQNLFHRQQPPNTTTLNACQTIPDQNTYTTSEVLGQCGNATLFNVWRPRARFIAPEGWMNDPMSLFTRSDGSFHVGYQSTSQHIRGGNMSQGAAHSADFTTWYDFSGPEGYQTIYPSAIYDIRAVFDGSIINPGYEGHPTLFYTSTTFGPLGAVAGEIEGVETQSMAWTEDDGQTWTKLNFGQGGNPVIYSWPEKNLTGFRDPYVFRSKYLSNLLIQNTNATDSTTTTTGTSFEDQWFSTLSGGQVDVGPHLWLYKQTEEGDFVKWDWAGRFFEINGLRESWSEWSGNFGINFETAFVARLNESGYTNDDGSDETAVEIIGYGTERGRDDHQLHWPLWAAVNYTTNEQGGFTADVLFAGVADWGASYAFVSVPYEKDGQSRHIMVGWTYEDEDEIVLAKQQGYQGALTLFRDLSIKYIRNVDPSAPGLYEKGSWGVKNETDGSVTVYTLGQKVVQETVDAYREGSEVSRFGNLTLDSEGSTTLDAQPKGRHYRLSADFTFEANTTRTFGMRVLASDAEYTDIVYDPAAEELTVNREQTSIIKSFNNRTEVGKLRIWSIVNQTSKTLSLSVYVDNSVVEIYANDQFALTTRAYPWYANSTGVSLLANGTTGSAAIAGNVELWDGLVNAWPERPNNTSMGLVWDGPIADIWGLYPGY